MVKVVQWGASYSSPDIIRQIKSRRMRWARHVVGVEWIHLAQKRVRWQALVNAVMNLWVLAPQT
jgi:hypothetical protein